jgi:hypothetical protein
LSLLFSSWLGKESWWGEAKVYRLCILFPSSEDTARIRASEGETAGAFLWTIPTTPNTTIPNSALKTAIKRRVGLNLQVPGICKCGKSISATGSHILTCTHGVGNHLRHNQVKHLLLNFSRRAGYSVQDEPTLLHDLATSKKGKRGDGLIYHASHEGKNIIFDVTFTDPQSPSNIAIGAHKDITTAFKTRETAKHNKYKHQIARAVDTVDFQPLAMTVYGSVNNLTKKLISQLADRIAKSTGVPKSAQRDQLHYR